ncbi:hypothetical protein FRUB_00701 [Fimbriiglobus ruber]|uniref:General secretion pathway protein I n=1 Tax=Fimbriiglobus ruber TaxID=1908690 RepID=A0A225E0B8_9BACT|nr:hypothetical protein FRUB_00701 [Fimbriiglobus ruber]
MALAVFAVAATLVAQFATWSLAERARSDARLEAIEAAANVLEQARARGWNELTPEWGAGMRLPESISARWPDCHLTVRVEPEPNRHRVKRVTVEIRWTDAGRVAWTPVSLTGLFADRATEGKT